MGLYTDGVHLVTDTALIDLHRFAQEIGVRRCWFQGGPRSHYDLTTARKAQLAARHNADRVNSREIIKTLRRGKGR